MKKLSMAVLLVVAGVFSYAQTREDVGIYIPMPTGGTSEQQAFFQEQFAMETTAAGYKVVDSARDSDYTLKLIIKPNMITYEDGTQEQAPEGEKQNVVELHLERTGDGTEIVMFDFPFTDMEEMYEFNLFLLYQAMANVPMTKLTAVIESDHWRNKWVYIRASFNFDLSVFDGDKDKENKEYSDVQGGWVSARPQTARAMSYSPGGVIGVEFQFLNWMSLEGDIKFIFGDPEGSNFIPTLGAALKFPLKPAKYYMLEPYAAVDFPMFTGGQSYIKDQPRVAVGGGFQMGVRGGERGAFFVDVSGMYTLGDLHTRVENSRDIYWNRWVISFGVGYKVGFLNRNPD